MVPAVLRRASSTDGLQPLSLARDWRQVLKLIEVAFGEELDADARRALRSMRLSPLLAPLIGFLDSLALPGESMMPGFVWLDGGRVVGTASVRRTHHFSNGWLISNVAVHPDWQGQGIGRALLEACQDYAQEYGGTWLVLQVRDSNAVAHNLYESLGFQPIGEVRRLRKPELGTLVDELSAEGLRPSRWYDGSALSSLARTLTPHDVLWADSLNRDLYKTSVLNQLVNQLQGYHRRWWVQDGSGVSTGGAQASPAWKKSGLRAAVGVEVDSRTPWHRLRLLVAPRAQDQELSSKLIAFGLRQLVEAPSLPIEIEHPASDAATQTALTEADFEPLYALIHMRLDFKSSLR